MAEVGYVIPPSVGVISGLKPDSGEPFINQIFLGFGAGAASPVADAWVTVGHVGNAGLCYQDSAEVDEQVFPIFVKSRQFVTDSGGAGRYRGGGGMQVEFGPEGCDLEIGYVSDGTVNAANGARGGGSGGRAQQYVRRGNGEGETLDPCVQVPLSEGEFIVSVSCGGGGFGSPLACPAVDVAHDARERWISIEAAEHVYGVVLSADGSADIAASEALRNRMSAAVF